MKRLLTVIITTLISLIKLILLLFKSLLIFLVLPIYLTTRAVSPRGISIEVGDLNNNYQKIILRRLLLLVATLIIIYPIWGTGYVVVQQIVFQKLGFSKEEILISGTGSMYPTFPKGEGADRLKLSREIVSTSGMFPYPNGFVLGGKRYLGYKLQRGDIVVVEDEDIRTITASVYGTPSGWVKRVIALPGDKIELREGLVYLNKEPQREQYTALPRSTFGQSFLRECKEVEVPENNIFVMGDNRKGSGDSREIGFISIDSVNHVLPISSQVKVLDGNWRDTSEDLSDSAKIKINKADYLELLNEKRKEAGVSTLKYDTKLENSAKLRGEIILKFDDLSFEATRSGYTMKDSMVAAGYSNIVWGEIPTLGYYEARELIGNQFEFPKARDFLLEKDFDDIGIAEVAGFVNGCPAQVVVMHFGGYVPPNYSQEVIDSWKSTLLTLRKIQPSWRELKNYPDFYNKHKVEIDRINFILDTRISNITNIVETMESNEWLSQSETRIIEDDEVLSREQTDLANKINSF